MMVRKSCGKIKEEEEVLAKCEEILKDHNPPASLLHGDLWSGNKAFLSDGTPVIFDPATYYGDRETDLAMTEVFGGFSEEFYETYDVMYKIDENYKTRKNIYCLYHALNHMNLFGNGYRSMAMGYIYNILK